MDNVYTLFEKFIEQQDNANPLVVKAKNLLLELDGLKRQTHNVETALTLLSSALNAAEDLAASIIDDSDRKAA